MFVKFVTIQSIDPVVEYLSSRIVGLLASGRSVLWLVPGGSSVKVAIAVSQQLVGKDLSKLTVTLTDERYGDVGHPNSNWQQLLAGGFSLSGAKLVPVLNGKPMAATVEGYDGVLSEQLSGEVYSLGLFGMGADGHTAGILPGSLVADVNALAAGYEAGSFERITITPKTIGMLDEAVVYAVGDDKREALDNLEKELPISEQPAQVLKTVNMLSIFNDYKGEAVAGL